MTSIERLLTEIRDAVKAARPFPENMDVEMAADYMVVGVSFLRELIAAHKIPTVRPSGVGKRKPVRLRKMDLDAYMAAHLVRGPADALRLNDGRRREAA